MNKHYVFLENSKLVFELSKLIKKEGIKSTIAPTPREADHCCGICIIYENLNEKERIKTIADENNILIDDFAELENRDDPNRNKYC